MKFVYICGIVIGTAIGHFLMSDPITSDSLFAGSFFGLSAIYLLGYGESK